LRTVVNLVLQNKAKQHTDTHIHTYKDTDSVLITGESTEFTDQCTKMNET